MSDVNHWANKLEKIQFAISMLVRAKKSGVDAVIDSLQTQEDIAAKDLIDAEQLEEASK